MSAPRVKTIHDEAYRVLVECLRAARQEGNVTQTDLAERLGTDQSYVSKYERVERRLDVIEVRAVCRALGADFCAFIAAFEKELKRRGVS
jgi:transcriptional regulator with XRE-family HTH domain